MTYIDKINVLAWFWNDPTKVASCHIMATLVGLAQGCPNIEKFFEKNFLIGNDLEWSKMCFKTKVSILKMFPRSKIFLWDIAVFSKRGVWGKGHTPSTSTIVKSIHSTKLSDAWTPMGIIKTSSSPSGHKNTSYGRGMCLVLLGQTPTKSYNVWLFLSHNVINIK